MTNKVSTQLLVSPHTRDRSRALAIVRRESVAEVNRTALEGSGLKAVERQHTKDLDELTLQISRLAPGRRSDALEIVLRKRIGLERLGELETLPW